MLEKLSHSMSPVIPAIQTRSGSSEEPITPAGMNDHLSVIKVLSLWLLLDSYGAIMSGNVRLGGTNLTRNGTVTKGNRGGRSIYRARQL